MHTHSLRSGENAKCVVAERGKGFLFKLKVVEFSKISYCIQCYALIKSSILR